MPKPILQSLILADHVYEDKLTGKRIIAGVFNRIIRGVRVFKDVPPPAAPPQYPAQPFPAQQQIPSPQSFPPHPEVPAQPPPYAPQTEIVAPGFTPPPPAQPPPWQQPPQPAPQFPAGQPSPPAAPAPPPQTAPAAVPPSYQPPPAPAPAASPAPPTAPTAEHPAAPWQQPAARSAQPSPPPPAPPSTPPLQPGQRVLEIPPTGFQSGSPFAYLSLTEVRGLTPLMLQLVNLQDDSQLFRSDLRVDCPNPLYTVEITVPLPPITPPQAGIYALEVMYQNEILGSLRIVVEDAPQ